jgi:hydroxyethylthiazole kinase-like uncharacterized protein yjeF
MSRSGSRDAAESGDRAAGWPESRWDAPPPQPKSVIREWDRRAIEEFGVPGVVLMENAGAGAARILARLAAEARGDPAQPIRILCGQGNNGGDGLVVARHLHNLGFQVAVRLDPAKPFRDDSDAAVNYRIVHAMGLEVAPISVKDFTGSGWLVDALFGTGLSRALGAPWIDWVREINASRLPVLALDIPSGLDADTGEALGAAVRALHTVTFAAPKVGFFRALGPACCGQIHVVDIGMPRAIYAAGSH